MPETRQVSFSHQEIAEILIKHQNIYEGLWGVYIEFGLAATNIPNPDGDFVPASVVPLQRIGLQRFDEEVQGLTVDAAKANPSSE